MTKVEAPIRAALAAAVMLTAPIQSWAAGATAAPFLRLGFGARPLGVGEAFVASADDVSALYYNPAGLARLAGTQLLVGHALHFQDIRISQAGLVRRPFGVSVTYLTVDGIEQRSSETAEPEGTFGASDLAVGVSYASELGPVSLGVTGKLIQQQIGRRSASAVAADVGMRWPMVNLPLSFGVSVANVGTDVRFVSEGYPLPTTLRVGAAWGATRSVPANFGAQVDFSRDSAPIGRVGVEYLGFGPLPLRAGYMLTDSSDRSVMLGRALGRAPTGLSQFFGLFMGFGFKATGWSLDYALTPYGELGASHRISIDVRFR